MKLRNQKHKGLLIYAPSQLMDVEIPKSDSSIGLLYLASALEKNGILTDILDANIGDGTNLKDTLFRFVPQENGLFHSGMSFQEIAEYVKKGGYTFCGINSNVTLQTRMVIETAKAIKNINKNIKVYTGGTSARVLYERLLNTGYFDGVCLTDGEIIFPRVVLEGIENVPGWAYIKRCDCMSKSHPFQIIGSYSRINVDCKECGGMGTIIKVNPVNETCFPTHLDDLPMPAWKKLPRRNYDTREITDHKDEPFATIITSRGCRFHCAYCHISGKKKDVGKLRLHSLDRVVTEIKRLKELGIRRIYIEDDSFLVSKDRVRKLFELIKNEDVILLGVNGINLIDLFTEEWAIDVDFIKVLYDNGYRRIAFPVESGSQRILDKYCSRKVDLDKMDIIKLMEVLTTHIEVAANIVIGFPDETEEEIQKSIELGKALKRAGALYITFFFATPYPGTKFYDMCIEGGYLDKNTDIDCYNWKRPIMKNTVVSKERLIEIQKMANIECNDKTFIQEMEAKNIRSLLNSSKTI